MEVSPTVAEPEEWDDRILRFRRGRKRLLLVVEGEARRDELTRALVMDGYRHVRIAGSLVQGLIAAKAATDLVALESQVGAHPGLTILGKLREMGLPKGTPSVLFSEEPSVRENLAAKVLGVRVVPSPLDYPGPLKAVLDEVLGAEG